MPKKRNARGMSKAEKLAILDTPGGRLPDPEREVVRLLDQKQVRDWMLLPTLLWVGLTHMRENRGKIIRGDMIENLHRSVRRLIDDRPVLEVTMLAERVIKDADTVMQSAEAEYEPHAILGACHMILRLCDEGLLPDPGEMAVLVALVIVQEATEDDEEGQWRWNEFIVQKVSKNLYDTAQRLGYL